MQDLGNRNHESRLRNYTVLFMQSEVQSCTIIRAGLHVRESFASFGIIGVLSAVSKLEISC